MEEFSRSSARFSEITASLENGMCRVFSLRPRNTNATIIQPPTINSAIAVIAKIQTESGPSVRKDRQLEHASVKITNVTKTALREMPERQKSDDTPMPNTLTRRPVHFDDMVEFSSSKFVLIIFLIIQ